MTRKQKFIKDTVYTYRYPLSRKALNEKLDDKSGMCHNYDNGSYLIEIKDDDRFFLGLEGSHLCGNYYIANVAEDEKGLKISGKIVSNPDENGNPKIQDASKSVKEIIGIALMMILLFPITVLFGIFALVEIICKTVSKIMKKPKPRPTYEQRLDKFMIEYLDCKKI